MLRTNTKIYQDRIEQYLIDCIDTDQIELPDNLLRDEKRTALLQYVWTCFDSEYNFIQNRQRIPNLQDRLESWLQGLPSAISVDFNYVDILEKAAQLHNEVSFDEKMENYICEHWFKHVAFHLLRILRKYGVKTTI